MKKNIALNNIRLLVMAFIVVVISSYKSSSTPIITRGIKTVNKNYNRLADNDLEIIRTRIVDDLLKPEIDPDKINKLVKIIQPDGSWPGINYKDTTKTGFEHRRYIKNKGF